MRKGFSIDLFVNIEKKGIGTNPSKIINEGVDYTIDMWNEYNNESEDGGISNVMKAFIAYEVSCGICSIYTNIVLDIIYPQIYLGADKKFNG